MKRILMTLCVAVLAMSLTIGDAEARRLGGSRSFGMQRSTVAPKPAPAPAPQQTTAAPKPAPTATPATPTSQPRRSWLGPLAGLAAGIGLAALLSHFGLGEGFAGFIMLALLVVAAIAVFRMLFGRRAAPPHAEPLQYAGVGGPGMAPLPASGEVRDAAPPSAAAVTPALQRNIPADFDADGFLRVAKLNFIRLQAANDAGNIADLREFLAPEVFAEVTMQLEERGQGRQETDVVTLEGELLEVVTDGDRHVASVHFSGLIREEAGGSAQPFDEVWNLTKPVDGSRGWQVAGIQQLS